jgi:hypothetical protein
MRKTKIHIAGAVILILLALPAFSQTSKFYRGINVNGPSVMINGRQWHGDNAEYFKCENTPVTVSELDWKPEPGDDVKKILRTFRWNSNARLTITDVSEGTYSVWAYLLEDNESQQYDIFVENLPALNNYESGPVGTWNKAGPWIVEVDDGDIEITSRGGHANFCGIEIWSRAVEGGKKLKPATSPKSPYLGRFSNQKPRIVVMTDIGGDPDDRQSLVRFLLYCCDFEVEGLCTGFGHGHYKNTRPELIHEGIDAYSKVYENLLKHNKDYPSPEHLHSLVQDGYNGDPHSVGPVMDSDASRWIAKALQKDDRRPVWFSIWGGPRELAQAIWRLDQRLSDKELSAIKKKIRVHSINDQDRTAGWIKKKHPDVFWIFSNRVFRGIWGEGNQSLVSPEWLKKNVLDNHGALGMVYPENASGKKGVKEGDTPSFLYVLQNGLSDPEAPQWGNWGGRFQYSGHGWEYLDAIDSLKNNRSVLATIYRWRRAYQNDFEARMDWCVKSPEKANHAPIVVCNNQKGPGVLKIKANPNDKIQLSANDSGDPDGDNLKYRWWIYEEPSTYDNEVNIENNNRPKATVHVPKDAKGKSIHVILEVTDSGEPPLTRYRRVIIECSEEK